MESKPVQFGNGLHRINTFNRTSMESKLAPYRPDVASGLLIEPVWNRNEASQRSYRLHPTSFNRTSMESKLLCSCPWSRKEDTFNRTSMESKLLEVREKNGAEFLLLIEPVWNRNYGKLNHDDTPNSLLIEPVWNRNLTYRDQFGETLTF